jgi:hypothetical protein
MGRAIPHNGYVFSRNLVQPTSSLNRFIQEKGLAIVVQFDAVQKKIITQRRHGFSSNNRSLSPDASAFPNHLSEPRLVVDCFQNKDFFLAMKNGKRQMPGEVKGGEKTF